MSPSPRLVTAGVTRPGGPPGSLLRRRLSVRCHAGTPQLSAAASAFVHASTKEEDEEDRRAAVKRV